MSPPRITPDPAAEGVATDPTVRPYRHSDEHLWDELRRIDQLLRARTVHWRATLAASKPESLWGMIHVSEAEVDHYLSAPFTSPRELPADLEAALAPFWQAAADLARATAQRRAETSADVELRLDRLTRCFALSDLERDVLLVSLLPEVDGRFRRLFGYLQDDATRHRPSVELVLEILRPLVGDLAAGRQAFDARATLRDQHLLVLTAGDEPFPMRSISPDQGIASYLLGREGTDPRLLPALAQPEGNDIGQQALSQDRRERLQAMGHWWKTQAKDALGASLFLHGAYGSGRLSAARFVCEVASQPILALDVGKALELEDDWPTTVSLAHREAALHGAALCWDRCEALLDKRETDPRWTALIEANRTFVGLSFFTSSIPWDPVHRQRPFPRIDLPMPSHVERQRLWETLLPPDAALADRPALAATLANSFQLTGGQIADAVASAASYARQRCPGQPEITARDLYAGCRRQSSHGLQSFARRVEPRPDLDLDDLILPRANRRQIEELRQRIRHRHQVLAGLGFERRLSLGRGLIALFTGSSGTGKSMAAELLAREQGVDLYKVDLSSVVSKYVGETEKNLRQVFDQAEDANAVLFFDEADSLFGQRGEVKDARDRWANMEINYLLQRVEEYSGVVILTSNLRQNIDAAFLRRLQMIIEFPFPDEQRRFLIWRTMFPAGLERPDDDQLRVLAKRFRFSGGEIKNIVLDAAFRALAETRGEAPAIRHRHLIAAIVREYQKTGKPVTVKDFGEQDFEWISTELQ